MGSLSFEPTDENIELVEALLEGLNEISKKLSTTQESEENPLINLESIKMSNDVLRDPCRHCPHF